MASARPRTRYARSGAVSIAYQIVGEGPVDLVHCPGFISHLEYGWEEPAYARYLRRLASFSRLILFDKRGTGLSDHAVGIPTLEERMDDVRAVMDAAGSATAVIFGFSESAPLGVLFAATHPERTAALVLYNAYASEVQAPDYPWAPTLAEYNAAVDERARDIHERWGVLDAPGAPGDVLTLLAPTAASDPSFRAWFATFQRLAASPGSIVNLERMNALIDIRGVLPSVGVPTLVIHRRGPGLDEIAERSRYVADRIPGARLVELPGIDYLPWIGDADAVVDEIESFVTGTRPARRPLRTLATVLVTEIENAARRAAVLGDRRWSDLQERFEALARRELEARRARIVSIAADRIIATFDRPVDAIRCAEYLRDEAAELGLATRAGVHTGECEFDGDRVAGIAMALASWVAARSAGEIFVSSTVKDLVMGARLEFADRGMYSIDGRTQWRLFAVVPPPAMTETVPPQPPAPVPASLTPREREVFGLVVRGMTNRQIAQALHIGERTAESHVASILAKCGLSNRAQIAAGVRRDANLER